MSPSPLQHENHIFGNCQTLPKVADHMNESFTLLDRQTPKALFLTEGPNSPPLNAGAGPTQASPYQAAAPASSKPGRHTAQ